MAPCNGNLGVSSTVDARGDAHESGSAESNNSASKNSSSESRSSTSGASTSASSEHPLPACQWPASAAPTLPPGALADWIVSRAEIACGADVADGGPIDGLCPTDGGFSCSGQVLSGCINLCAPDQYALVSNLQATGPRTFDASVVSVVVPSACVLQHAYPGQLPDTPEGRFKVQCCPCQ